jgi:hypothetical protein
MNNVDQTCTTQCEFAENPSNTEYTLFQFMIQKSKFCVKVTQI